MHCPALYQSHKDDSIMGQGRDLLARASRPPRNVNWREAIAFVFLRRPTHVKILKLLWLWRAGCFNPRLNIPTCLWQGNSRVLVSLILLPGVVIEAYKDIRKVPEWCGNKRNPSKCGTCSYYILCQRAVSAYGGPIFPLFFYHFSSIVILF